LKVVDEVPILSCADLRQVACAHPVHVVPIDDEVLIRRSAEQRLDPFDCDAAGLDG